MRHLQAQCPIRSPQPQCVLRRTKFKDHHVLRILIFACHVISGDKIPHWKIYKTWFLTGDFQHKLISSNISSTISALLLNCSPQGHLKSMEIFLRPMIWQNYVGDVSPSGKIVGFSYLWKIVIMQLCKTISSCLTVPSMWAFLNVTTPDHDRKGSPGAPRRAVVWIQIYHRG